MLIEGAETSIKQCFACGAKAGMLSKLGGSNCKGCGRSFCTQDLFIVHTGPLDTLEKVWNQQIGFFEKKLPTKVDEWLYSPMASDLNRTLPFCSEECASGFITSQTQPVEREYVGRVKRGYLVYNHNWGSGGSTYSASRILLRDNFTDRENLRVVYDKHLTQTFSVEEKREEAEIALKSGRFEDAAQIYEGLGDYQRAGEARARERTTKQVVQQQIVDINALLEQLRNQRMVVPYKCPNCQGTIKITGTTESRNLMNCEYCGSLLAERDLAEYLSSV
jgi:DNA-directed RNA polymerase subunit RPC12/RpoP